MVVHYVPSLKQRRRAMLACGSYFIHLSPWLRAPLRVFPAGMYPFGHELDHLEAA